MINITLSRKDYTKLDWKKTKQRIFLRPLRILILFLLLLWLWVYHSTTCSTTWFVHGFEVRTPPPNEILLQDFRPTFWKKLYELADHNNMPRLANSIISNSRHVLNNTDCNQLKKKTNSAPVNMELNPRSNVCWEDLNAISCVCRRWRCKLSCYGARQFRLILTINVHVCEVSWLCFIMHILQRQ